MDRRALQPLALLIDRLEHRIRMPEHVVVHEADHVMPVAFQSSGPPFVIRGAITVRVPVEFHDKLHLMAVEVRDVSRKPVLPAKLEAGSCRSRRRRQSCFSAGAGS